MSDLKTESSPSTPAVPVTKFRTNSLGFATILAVARLLEYVRVEVNAKTRNAEFVFEDPDNKGSELLRRFNVGLVPDVNPKVFLEARGYFLKELEQARAGGANAQK